jgi:hypothetical protein
MTWDRVRIEPSATEPGCADLFLMTGTERTVDNVIAHLPIRGEPSKASVLDDRDWTFMLDVLAEINERHDRGATVLVETSTGDRWEHRPPDQVRGRL